jgi:hypothetical protein
MKIEVQPQKDDDLDAMRKTMFCRLGRRGFVGPVDGNESWTLKWMGDSPISLHCKSWPVQWNTNLLQHGKDRGSLNSKRALWFFALDVKLNRPSKRREWPLFGVFSIIHRYTLQEIGYFVTKEIWLGMTGDYMQSHFSWPRPLGGTKLKNMTRNHISL